MELRHLHCFVAVAEELHFGRAAARLHLTQPHLSRQIRSLEVELGVQLFTRTKRQVQLTDAARVFLEDARRLLAQAEQAIQTVKQAARGEVGQLRLSFTGAALHGVVPALIQAFRERYPQVELTLQELCTVEQVEALRLGKVDLGFLHPPLTEQFLRLEPLLSEPLVIALRQDHPLAERSKLPLQALANEPFILHPRPEGPHLYDQFLGLCERAGFRPRVVQEVAMHQTVIGLVAAGIGVALIPASLQELLRSGVVYRAIEGPAPQLPLAAAFRPDQGASVLQVFLKVVREFVPPNLADPAECLPPIE